MGKVAIFTGAVRHFSGSVAAEAPKTATPKFPYYFVSEGCVFPDPTKTKAGRDAEDAIHQSRYTVAVADGVGGWASYGIDPGDYARKIMQTVGEAAEDSVTSGVPPDALELIKAAYKNVKVQGSSTILTVVVRPDSTLDIRNLGDSGMQIWRHTEPLSLIASKNLRLEEAAKLWSLEFETKEQCHDFNMPYQLMYMGEDRPSDSQPYKFQPNAGDVVILATDGIWDNLYTHNIQEILARFDYSPIRKFIRMKRVKYLEALKAERKLADKDSVESATENDDITPKKLNMYGFQGKLLEDHVVPAVQPESFTETQILEQEKECRAQLLSIATLIASKSQAVGADKKAVTPFSESADKHYGRKLNFGGKLDDSSVVVAIVVPDDQTFEIFQ